MLKGEREKKARGGGKKGTKRRRRFKKGGGGGQTGAGLARCHVIYQGSRRNDRIVAREESICPLARFPRWPPVINRHALPFVAFTRRNIIDIIPRRARDLRAHLWYELWVVCNDRELHRGEIVDLRVVEWNTFVRHFCLTIKISSV